MKGEIIKIWVVVDEDYTPISEHDTKAEAIEAADGMYEVKRGYVYECDDYGSPVYYTMKELRKCETIE